MLKKKLNLKRVLFILPNAFTAGTIFSGLMAIIYLLGPTTPEALYRSCMAIFFAGFFDLFDGRIARLTKTQSSFGTELDSLADMVSFGAAPALLLYQWADFESWGIWGFIGPFFYALCGAIRLARFNLMAQSPITKPGFFIGLPIPLAAFMMVSLILTQLKFFPSYAMDSQKAQISILFTCLLIGGLMVSTVPYWSFKNTPKTPRNLAIIFGMLGLTLFLSIRSSPGLFFACLAIAYIMLGLLRYVIFRFRNLYTCPLV